MAILDGFSHYGSIVILLISGIAADLMFRSIKDREASDWRYKVVFFLIPVLIWGLYFADLSIYHTLDWAPELWGGTMFICGLCSMGLSILAGPIVHRKN